MTVKIKRELRENSVDSAREWPGVTVTWKATDPSWKLSQQTDLLSWHIVQDETAAEMMEYFANAPKNWG